MIIMRITGTFDFIVMIITFLTNYIILCHYNILLGHFPILRHRSQAGPAHQVVYPVPQRAQGRTPEMGALHTHGQWTDLLYICTDSFYF